MPSFTPKATAVQEIQKSIAHNARPVRFGHHSACAYKDKRQANEKKGSSGIRSDDYNTPHES